MRIKDTLGLVDSDQRAPPPPPRKLTLAAPFDLHSSRGPTERERAAFVHPD